MSFLIFAIILETPYRISPIIMDPRIVIVAYRPKPGKENELKQLALEHYAILKNQEKDGTIVEVFEWKSRAAIEQAHTNQAVLQMWEQYNQVCDYIPFGKVDESASLFSEFTPLP
jgi:quinol monooxygenase YgiN